MSALALARLSTAKSRMGLTTTGNDAAIAQLIIAWSAAIQNGCRPFAATVETVYLQARRSGSRCIVFGRPHDVVSISDLDIDATGSYTYGTQLTENTDFWLVRPNTEAGATSYRAIDVHPNSTKLGAWPTAPRSIRAVIVSGFSYETEACTVTAAEAMDASETGLDLSAAGGIDVGETILIDSEQMYVSAVTTTGNFTATVERGVNGTTAASHSNGATIYRRRYPRPVEEACVMQVARYWHEVQNGGADTSGDPAYGGFRFSALYPAIRDMLMPYRLPGVA